MNIQLFFENQELELNDKISFPLNKAYENLNNPTDIIVDYSKSINIPITANNNKIFANAYRLDKSFIEGDTNIGMYLNPMKRIPFKMTYNGTILLEGYAKFVSASYSIKNKYYTVNLFGAIGEVFQELLNVVTDSNKLNGLDGKYVLNDYKYVNEGENELHKSFVRNCWEKEDNVAWVQGKYDSLDVLDMYGFAPSHRGRYNDFKSNRIQTSSTTIKDIAQHFKDTWNDDNDAYGADNIVGDGFPDYQMNQFRTNHLKPFVYFNHIMRMYVDKCKELTGYEIVLDETWFNRNNPYWAKLCYMLDFLDLDLVDTASDVILMVSSTNEITAENSNMSNNSCYVNMQTLTSAVDAAFSNRITIDKFDIGFGVEVEHKSALRINEISILPDTQVIFTINVDKIGDAGLTTVSTKTYWTNGANDPNYHTEAGCTASNFLTLYKDTKRSKGKPYAGNEYNYAETDKDTKDYHYVTVPSYTILNNFPKGYQIDVSVKFVNKTGLTYNDTLDPALYKWDWIYLNSAYVKPAGVRIYGSDVPYTYVDGELYEKDGKATFTAYVDNTPYIKNWRSNMTVDIKNLYQSDEPLFNVILEYTKMFGLVWDVDYNEKKLYIKTKQSLFKDLEVINWDNKLDRSQDMKIEPISFDTKVVLFNYNNIDGYRYSGYRDKYGINIGDKKLYTGYEFNTNDKPLFNNIDPSSVSSKTYIPYNSFINWNTVDTLIPKQEQRVLIDCENEDESSSISINNWYFRGPNIIDNEVIITDDSALMAASKEYCYMDRTYALTDGNGTDPGVFPTFSTAIEFKDRTYGMFFNTPNVDYTYDKLISQTINSNIYDLFWRNYINEKYNPQNKKVTAYFNLSISDYERFKFNKLIVLSGQLFIVNKIIDFNISRSGSTKCELIQISDLSAYTKSDIDFS